MISILRLGFAFPSIDAFSRVRLSAVVGLAAERARARVESDVRSLIYTVSRTAAGRLLRSRIDDALKSRAATAALSRLARRVVTETPRIEDRRAWSLATASIGSAADVAASAGQLQTAAALQIDAAVYALDGLLGDLRQVMDLGALYPSVVRSLDTAGTGRRSAAARAQRAPAPVRPTAAQYAA